MYLSRLILNPRSRQVQRELAAPYQMHRTIMKAFPERLPPDERVLFRVDAEPRTGALTLLVQSQHAPDWSALDAAGKVYLLPAQQVADGLPNPAVKEVSLRLAAGQTLAFRLCANPTAKRTFEQNGKKEKKRVGLYREDEQLRWLERKARDGGFRVLSVRARKDDHLNQGHLMREGERHDLKMLSVQYDGLLQVADPEQLQQTVAQGIGSGKGLGFGLLSLAPVR